MIPNPIKGIHLAVKEAYDAGLCVVPPREDGTKAPEAYWKEFQAERAPIEILRDAYRNGRTGLGIVCGAVSGQLECMDFDTPEMYGKFKQACGDAGLDELLERIETGYSEATPHGFHLLYRPLTAKGCHKLARTENFETLIEVKAEGGYIIVSPTFGEVNRDGPYVRVSGSAATIAEISNDDRDALYRVAETFDATPKVDGLPFCGPVEEGKGDRPGDDFIRRGSWDFLIEAGWAKVAEGADPEGRPQEFWRRPGKDRGNSAILHPVSGLFYVFSSSTAFPAVPAAYNKFRTLVFTMFGGDFKAATAYVKSRGFLARKSEPVTLEVAVAARPVEPDEFGGLRGDQIFDLEVPDIEHLPILGHDGFVMRGAANLLYAFPKAGKTELTASLVREWIAAGERIVYLSEEPLFFWKERFEIAAEPPDFWVPATFYPAMGWGLEKTLRALSLHREGVLVVDTIRNTIGYQEAKGDEDVARLIVPLITAARDLDMTLVALYHARKMPGENGTDISGHHSLYGAFDRAIQLRRIDGDENERKRRLVVSGRLLDPMAATKLTYIMRDDGAFDALDTDAIIGKAKRCVVCNGEFQAKRSTARFCSPGCRLRSYRKPDVNGA